MKRYDFDKSLLFGDGVIEWKELTHPQYGKIEVGGVEEELHESASGIFIRERCASEYVVLHLSRLSHAET